MKLIDADALRKLFDENLVNVCHDVALKVIDEAPSVRTKQIKYFDEDEAVWKIGEVIVDEQMD